jgi:hypothetical protein
VPVLRLMWCEQVELTSVSRHRSLYTIVKLFKRLLTNVSEHSGALGSTKKTSSTRRLRLKITLWQSDERTAHSDSFSGTRDSERCSRQHFAGVWTCCVQVRNFRQI